MPPSKSKKTASRQKGERLGDKYAKAYKEVFDSLPPWKKQAVLEDSVKNIDMNIEKFSVLALFVKEVIKKAENP
jgi:hypothetical protein